MMNNRVSAFPVWVLVMIVFAAPLVSITSHVGAQETDGVSRLLPGSAECGETIDVTLDVQTPDGTNSWVADEAPPELVSVVSVDSTKSGEYKEDQHKVKWVSLSGTGAQLSYTITIPADTPNGTQLTFTGEYRFDPSMDERAQITGDSTLNVTCQDEEDDPQDPGNDGDTGDGTGGDGTQDENDGEQDLGEVTRTLPQEVSCGDTFTVTLNIVPPAGTSSWIVEESPPAGADVPSVDDRFNGEFMEEQHAVKWLSFEGSATQVSYDVSVPPTAGNGQTLAFSGEYRFHPAMDNRSQTLGDDELTVTCESVVRSLPTVADAGSTIQVSLQVTPLPGTTDWILDESPPTQAAVADVDPSHEGVYLEDHHRVKWVHVGPHEPEQPEPTLVTYNVTLDEDLESGTTLTFNGSYRFHPVQNASQTIMGDQTLCIATCGGSGGSGSGGGGGGGGGGGDDDDDDPDDPDDPRPPEFHNVQATAALVTPGALATYEAAFPQARAGDTVQISFDDPDVPQMDLELGSDLSGVVMTLTKWPGDMSPPGTGDLSQGTQTAFHLHVTGLGSGHRATFTTTIDPNERPEDLPRDRAVVLLAEDLDWTLVALMDLEDQDDRLHGTFTVDCCSVFAVAFDTQPPVVDLTVTVDEEAQTAFVRAEVIENVEVEKVEFFINQDHWRTFTEAPFEFTLDIQGYTPGQQVVAVRVEDSTGWSDDTTQGFQVQGTDGPETTSGGSWGLIAVIGAAGAIAIGGVYLHRSGHGATIRKRVEEAFDRKKQ